MLTEPNISIKSAASRLGLKYENAKAIVKVYRKENWTKQLLKNPFIRHRINIKSILEPNMSNIDKHEEAKFQKESKDAVRPTQ